MKKIPFKIIGIETESFHLKDKVSLEANKRLDISTTFSFAVNKESKLVKSTADYTYVYDGDKVLSITLSCIFAIEDESFADMQKDGKFIIEPFFSQYLATINVGAARGEIHARCEDRNSDLSKVVLPPINLVSALPKPIVIELTKDNLK